MKDSKALVPVELIESKIYQEKKGGGENRMHGLMREG
jgi:hypothetical protein